MTAIGIVGGIGPYAGLDLNRKIFEQTVAKCDQDHLDVVLLSWPRQIPDRTAFLLDEATANPVDGIVHCLEAMDRLGVTIAGIACNTAHSPRIFDEIVRRLEGGGARLKLVNMIGEVVRRLASASAGIGRVGVLATNGTVRANAYGTVFAAVGIEVVYPDSGVQHELVHSAIYDTEYGIKAHSDPVTERARRCVLEAARHLLQEKNADALVLGCTELPLAIRSDSLFGKLVIDPTLLLARALVREAAPEKLRVEAQAFEVAKTKSFQEQTGG